MPVQYNGCENRTDLCYKRTGTLPNPFFNRATYFQSLEGYHRFDELVMDADAKTVDKAIDGCLNHIQYRAQSRTASKSALEIPGEYTTKYFPAVYEALEQRGLVVPFEILEKTPLLPAHNASLWMSFTYLQIKIDIAMASHGINDPKSISLDPQNKSILHDISLQDIMPRRSHQLHSLRRKLTTAENQNLTRHDNDTLLQSYTDNNKKDTEQENVKLAEIKMGEKEKEKVFHSTLPAFSINSEELFLASMIERESDTYNLHLTTFLLSHNMAVNDNIPDKISQIQMNKENIISWSKAIVNFNNTDYSSLGRRLKKPKYSCRIRLTSFHPTSTVTGLYVYVCMYCVYLCMYECMYVCMCLYLYVRTCVCVYVIMYVCVCIADS